MSFTLKKIEKNYIDLAPCKLKYDFIIKASSENIFNALIDINNLCKWNKDLISARLITFNGLSGIREIVLKDMTVTERFIVWEEGKRLSFTLDKISIPLVKNMAEDWNITSIAVNTSNVIWSVYYTPALIMKILYKSIIKKFNAMFSVTVNDLKKYLEK